MSVQFSSFGLIQSSLVHINLFGSYGSLDPLWNLELGEGLQYQRMNFSNFLKYLILFNYLSFYFHAFHDFNSMIY